MNGSLWTIPQEINCYLIIGILSLTGLLRWWVAALLCVVSLPLMMASLPTWVPVNYNFLFVFPCFAFGSLLYFLNARWGLRGDVALACIVLAVGAAVSGWLLQLFPLLGSYPLLWLATSERIHLPTLRRFGDISYGTYLYGWPTEQVVRAALGPSATWWAVFGLSLPISCLLGYLSWHLLEKRALKLKRLTSGRASPSGTDPSGSAQAG